MFFVVIGYAVTEKDIQKWTANFCVSIQCNKKICFHLFIYTPGSVVPVCEAIA